MIFKLAEVGKEFTGEWLLRSLEAQCNQEDRIGLIGRNGVGKTTLFNLIDGQLEPDEGSVIRSSDWSVSRMEQIALLKPSKTVLDEALEINSDLTAMEFTLRKLEHEMAEGSFSGDLANEYESIKSSFEVHGGYEYEATTKKVLHGLGFKESDFSLLCSQLSGGQRSRLLLARVLLKPAKLLLLDEPTNHLDLTAILWLEEYLKTSAPSFVAVSHDRDFLDSVTNRTWELENGKLADYPAMYSRSRVLKAEKVSLQSKAYEKQQEWKRQNEEFIRRNLVGQKTKQAQSRRSRLEKMQWIEKPVSDLKASSMAILEAKRGGSLVLEFKGGKIGYGATSLINDVNLTIHRGERVGFLGGNGSGKTSLIKTALGEIPLVEGELSWGQNNVPAFFRQESRFEDESKTVLAVLAEIRPFASDEELRSFAARFCFRGEDINKTVGMLSGGERSRLAFSTLFSRPCNVLFLDEPTNHLDIDSREALEAGLAGFGGAVIVVSHDLFFLRKVVDRYFLIRNRGLAEFAELEKLKTHLLEKPEKKDLDRPKAVRPARGQESGLSKNERKRIEQRLHRLESQIEELEKRKDEIESEMSEGHLDHINLGERSREYQVIDGKLADLLEQWEETSHHLE